MCRFTNQNKDTSVVPVKIDIGRYISALCSHLMVTDGQCSIVVIIGHNQVSVANRTTVSAATVVAGDGSH
jgi:hypothetical protein